MRLLKPWTSQPQGVVRADLSNPLNSRLLSLINGAAHTFNAANGSPNSFAFDSSDWIKVIGSNGTQALQSRNTRSYAINTVNSTISERTHFVVCKPRSLVTSSDSPLIDCNLSGWNLGTLRLGTGTNARFTSVINASTAISDSADYEVDKWYTVVSIAKAGRQELWVNGVLKASGTATLSNPNFNRNNSLTCPSTTDGAVHVSVAGSVGRAWTESEAAAFTANPWQLFAPRSIWLPAQTAAGGGSTGTVAYTNANDTSSASGTTTIVGTSAATNANDTSSASGTTTIVGTSAYTNANDTSSASGTTTVTGTSAYTNANDTATAIGTAGAISGTVAYTNANDTATASGWAGTISGTVSATNANDTALSSGSAGSQASGGFWWPHQRKRTRREIDEERRKLGILPPEVLEAVAAVKPEKRRIKLVELVGKPKAARITNVDLSEAIAISKKRKRQREDELLLLM